MEKLYNVPNNSRIDVSHLELSVEETGEPVIEVDFKHIDGMYSLSYFTDKEGNKVVLHLLAWTEVKIIE
tara:strand:- start:233 stop:439 length:207 start_codon:yes stop_codon:yes gene_type:complete